MMGRPSDTRIYNPRSESSEMFRANHEDERPATGIEDGRNKDAQKDKRQAKKEAEEKEDKKIRHIKVRNHHLGLKGRPASDMEDDEDEKFKPRGSADNPSDQTTPSGAGGFLTSLATQAKGPGAAGGEMIQMSEPMSVAYQLLKEEVYDRFQAIPQYLIDAARDGNDLASQAISAFMDGDFETAREMFDASGARPTPNVMKLPTTSAPPRSPAGMGAVSSGHQPRLAGEYEHLENSMGNTMDDAESLMLHGSYNHDPLKGEPMDFAWSVLKKSPSKRSVARRRKKEGYAKWRPSTGQFERPKGGSSPHTATSRRAKNISRNLPLGRKTGLMRPHLSVEFSHRGLASKQPMSKDPKEYRPYLASQEARKLLGGVRSTVSPHLSHSQRSFYAGDTGGGHLSGTLNYPRVPRPRLHQVRAPSIVPPKMKMPRLTRPKMPGMVTMSEDEIVESDILKAGFYDKALLSHMIKEIRELMRLKKDKDNKRKGKGNPDVSGAASNLPNYAGNNPVQTTKPEGGTEDENDARRWGMSPLDLVGRGSGRA